VSVPRKPCVPETSPANDNVRQGHSLEAKPTLPKADVRLPKGMPVQMVEVEVIAALLESLPPPANDNRDDGE
jgi:hypothetical protein